jgi:uncharacterized protein YbaA (DUF1428 family)
MAYVDGFIVAVPKKNLEAYRRMAKKAGKVWREHGALEYREWVAEDVKVGKRTSFPRSVKLKPGETVVFSWITYKSRAQRDRVNARVMADKRLAGMMDTKSLPFDAKRMIYGGCDARLGGGGRSLLARDGAVDGVDHDLGLDEFEPRPLGLVAVERCGQCFGEGVAVFGHALARLFQRLKSLAHVGFAFMYLLRFMYLMCHRIQPCFPMPSTEVRPRMLTGSPIPPPPAPGTDASLLSSLRTRPVRRARH